MRTVQRVEHVPLAVRVGHHQRHLVVRHELADGRRDRREYAVAFEMARYRTRYVEQRARLHQASVGVDRHARQGYQRGRRRQPARIDRGPVAAPVVFNPSAPRYTRGARVNDAVQPAPDDAERARSLGLWAATGVGVGAIVGGGVFVLAGVAFAAAGPAAAIAFAVNGAVAFLTAMSFAEIATAFPENGGAYTFAKKVLSVRAAFAVGWILWFAYIVAGVLYALGFASFAALAAQKVWAWFAGQPPAWLAGRRLALLLASGAAVAYAYTLVKRATGGGQYATVGKVFVFAVLIVAGLVALVRQDPTTSLDNLRPFVPHGMPGLLMAMGFTFIALQGFDLVAAIGGEVRDPGRTIPRAMFLSLGCALAIYLPLLLLVASVGVERGESIARLAAAQPEGVIPLAAERFMGPVGYWLVIVAAILSTLSALHANLLAASRVALSMARDRTLPAMLGDLHKQRRTPVMAIFASTLTLVAIVFMVPDLAAAGSASSLIFLVSFALAHLTVFLARRRGGTTAAPYRTPWFPTIPAVGGGACAALALFQAAAVPDAGGIALIWLGLGVMLYWSLFARQAEIGDAAVEAADPALMRLRGEAPLVLAPMANPSHATALVSVANALAARRVGRVLLLSIVPVADDDAASPGVPPQLEHTLHAIDDALRQSFTRGHRPEALITAAADPFAEIRRVAREHGCGAVVLGLGDLSDDAGEPALVHLIDSVDADVALVRAPAGWTLRSAERVLVPVGGRGDQHEVRARLLGTLTRGGRRTFTFVTVLPASASDADAERARDEIARLAELKVRGARIEIVRADDGAAAVLERAADFDLMVLGLPRTRRGVRLGPFARRVARHAPCAAIFLSRRRRGPFDLLEPLRDDVVESLRDVVRASPIRKPR
ncbi:MAG: amino acid permease [Deltaproteobacteria bacterium]|nr:MAG: amino acid permease [Deltaproteobacteria bacterium]